MHFQCIYVEFLLAVDVGCLICIPVWGTQVGSCGLECLTYGIWEAAHNQNAAISLLNRVCVTMFNQTYIHENRWLKPIALGLTLGAALLWSSSSYALDKEDLKVIPESDLPPKAEVMKQLNQLFPSEVVIPSYESLVEQMDTLVQATQRFETQPTEQSLSAVHRAWLGAVSSWATSNAVAFGPVHSLGYSTSLEFPTDATGIDTLLATEAENFDGIALLPSLQGFEAMAYVLGSATDKTAADFTERERRYLSALAVNAHAVAEDILQVWQVGWNNNPAYETLLSTAGQPGNSAYLSVEAGSEEIVRGIINSLDVVAAEELPLIVESLETNAEVPDEVTLQLLNSSLYGIQSAYLGTTVEQSAETAVGVSKLVAIANEDLNQQIQTSLVAAIASLEQAMAEPTNVQALATTQQSLETAFTLLETQVLPLVQR